MLGWIGIVSFTNYFIKHFAIHIIPKRHPNGIVVTYNKAQYTDVSEKPLYVLDSTALRFGEAYKNALFSRENRAFI